MNVSIQELNKLLESIKPLNFGRRFMFQKYCKYLVENGQINQCCVDKYTTKEFLYGELEMKEIEIFKIKYLRSCGLLINFIVNVGTVYVVYKLIRGLI